MESVVCKCGAVDKYRIEEKANNKCAYCTECGKFIKNIASDAPPQFFFGKYKGIPVKEVQDLGYLNWAFRKMKLTAKMKQAIADQIQKLEYEAA